MNKHEDESDLHEACELLRAIEPSVVAQLNNHKVVATELERLQASLESGPWWNRSIALPIPIAIGASLVLCTIAAIPWVSRLHVSSQQNTPRVTNQFADKRSIDDGPSLVTSTYLCGVGQVGRETIHKFEFEE